MRARGRRDSNHGEIVATLRKLGFSVADTGNIGNGFPDLVVGFAGLNALIEIKDGSKPPSDRRLTDDQRMFHADWKGLILVIETVGDCMALRMLMFDMVKVMHEEPQ